MTSINRKSNLVDITGTLYVLKDTTVTFKAAPDPPNSTFPANMPTWGGTAGATGTGATKQITFNTVSQNTSDYKTVIAGNPTAVTVNVIVYELTGTLNPQDYFTGRSTDRYGLFERIDLGFLVSPNITANQMGGLTWKIISGNGTLNNTTSGTDTYIAPKVVGNATLKIEVQNGPSKNSGYSFDKSIVAPNDAYMIKSQAIPGLWHCYGTSSVGFYGDVKLLPTDVSFARLYFREGRGTFNAPTGFYSSQHGKQHRPTPHWTPVNDCNIIKGCNAFLDQVYTGSWPPDPVLGFYYGDGTWPIDWNIGFADDLNPTVSGERFFMRAIHYQESNNIGTASIRKAGSGTWTRQVNDDEYNCQ